MENCAIRICKIAGGTQRNKIQLKPVEKELQTMIRPVYAACVCACVCVQVFCLV